MCLGLWCAPPPQCLSLLLPRLTRPMLLELPVVLANMGAPATAPGFQLELGPPVLPLLLLLLLLVLMLLLPVPLVLVLGLLLPVLLLLMLLLLLVLVLGLLLGPFAVSPKLDPGALPTSTSRAMASPPIKIL